MLCARHLCPASHDTIPGLKVVSAVLAMQDLSIEEIQRILAASRNLAEVPASLFKPISDEAIVMLDRRLPKWQDPMEEDNAARRPLLDKGLDLIAQVRKLMTNISGQGKHGSHQSCVYYGCDITSMASHQCLLVVIHSLTNHLSRPNCHFGKIYTREFLKSCLKVNLPSFPGQSSNSMSCWRSRHPPRKH